MPHSRVAYKANNNVVYACKYHVVWCPKYRRNILRGDVSEANLALDNGGAGCIDLNSAGIEQLDRLVHVGPARAETIIRGRPWGSVEALVRVRGLGEARVEDITESGAVCPLSGS